MNADQLCTIGGFPDRIQMILAEDITPRTAPELWDGHTAMRIVNGICPLTLGGSISYH